MATETGQENGGSSLRNLCCIFDIYDVKSSCWRFKKKEITLRSREERRWQEERVSRLMREMKDIEAVHLEKQDGGFVNCFMVHVCNDRQRPDHPALGVGGYSLHESS